MPALGGAIPHERDGRRIHAVTCLAREGPVPAGCTLSVLARPRRRGLTGSHGGRPYRISRAGRLAVQAQTDNQG
jgi:uncharacterized protein YjhX (UPF0386 family)